MHNPNFQVIETPTFVDDVTKHVYVVLKQELDVYFQF